MVGMVNEEQLKRMTPEQRVVNGYESLYFGSQSGDEQTNEVLRESMLRSFQRNDLALDDEPDDERMRKVFVEAYVDATASLQGEPATDEQRAYVTRSFARFEMTQRAFYERTAKAFENRHDGETLDLFTVIDRMERETPSNQEEPDLDAMAKDAGAFSYGAKADVALPQRQSYAEQVAASEAVAELDVEDVKQTRDADYDAYSLSHEREAKHRRFSAGDDYGFDEREDDGPEL